MSEHYTAVLDLRLFDPAERLGMVELSLQALAPGETLLVQTFSAPERLRAHIETQFPGAFDCQAVDTGPEVWSMVLRRRPSGHTPSLE